MKLTREERTRILAGDHSALKRKEEPDCAEGDTQVLIWSRARTVVVDRETGETAEYPRRALVWLELTDPIRHRDGGWRVSIKVHDVRVKPRFLGPSASPTHEDSLTPEGERGYRSSATGAIDHLEAVDDDELKRQDVAAKERFARHEEEAAADERNRRQERALREKIKAMVRELPPAAGQAFLAHIQRELEQFEEDT